MPSNEKQITDLHDELTAFASTIANGFKFARRNRRRH